MDAEETIMQLPDFLNHDDLGEITLAGHRIGLYHVIHYYREGYSPEMIVGQYPTLPLALVHKVIAFYLENTAEVDAYVGESETILSQERATVGRPLDLEVLRRRLGAIRKAETSAANVGS